MPGSALAFAALLHGDAAAGLGAVDRKNDHRQHEEAEDDVLPVGVHTDEGQAVFDDGNGQRAEDRCV